MNPITIPVELNVPLSGAQVKMLALLDSGCIRYVVRPELVEKLGLRLPTVKGTFC